MTAFQAVYVGSIPITRFAETLVYQGFFLFLLRVTTGYRLILFVFLAIKGMPHCEASLFSSLNLYFVLLLYSIRYTYIRSSRLAPGGDNTYRRRQRIREYLTDPFGMDVKASKAGP